MVASPEQNEALETSLAVTVRYFAGARTAAGVAEEVVRVERSGNAVSVADVVEAVRSRHGDQLAKVIAASSFLLNGVAVRDRDATVGEAVGELDVLPPFAGG